MCSNNREVQDFKNKIMSKEPVQATFNYPGLKPEYCGEHSKKYNGMTLNCPWIHSCHNFSSNSLNFNIFFNYQYPFIRFIFHSYYQ